MIDNRFCLHYSAIRNKFLILLSEHPMQMTSLINWRTWVLPVVFYYPEHWIFFKLSLWTRTNLQFTEVLVQIQELFFYQKLNSHYTGCCSNCERILFWSKSHLACFLAELLQHCWFCLLEAFLVICMSVQNGVFCSIFKHYSNSGKDLLCQDSNVQNMFFRMHYQPCFRAHQYRRWQNSK